MSSPNVTVFRVNARTNRRDWGTSGRDDTQCRGRENRTDKRSRGKLKSYRRVVINGERYVPSYENGGHDKKTRNQPNRSSGN